MEHSDGFYTQKGYQLIATDGLSASMEDYLEMICRLAADSGVVRVHEIAQHLHVKPSSASKMVNNLKNTGYLDFQKYGYIAVTEKGLYTGHYLLHRHKVLHEFLCLLNKTADELEQVEKIEHFINKNTLANIEKLTLQMKKQNESNDATNEL